MYDVQPLMKKRFPGAIRMLEEDIETIPSGTATREG
jgi:hypothetical protein